MVLDSWLDSVNSEDSWKWFHRASCEQSASASHQNQRAHLFICSGGFLSWGVRCSFTFLLQKWQQLASTLCFLGGFYTVVLSVSLYYKPVQSRTRSVYGCRKATEIRQLRACTTYHPAYFNFLIYPSLSCNLFCFHLRYVRQSQGLLTWSGGPRSGGVGFFYFQPHLTGVPHSM